MLKNLLFLVFMLTSLPLTSHADYVYTYTNAFSQEYDPESSIGQSFTISVNSPTLIPQGDGVNVFLSTFDSLDISCAAAGCETNPVPALQQGFYSVGTNGLPATWLFLLSFGSTTAYLGDYGATSTPETCGGIAVNSTFFDCVQTSETLSTGAKVNAYGLTVAPGTWSVSYVPSVPLPATFGLLLSGLCGIGLISYRREFVNLIGAGAQAAIPHEAVTGNSSIRRNLGGSRWPESRAMIWHLARSTVSRSNPA